jgi:hypothetical protein
MKNQNIVKYFVRSKGTSSAATTDKRQRFPVDNFVFRYQNIALKNDLISGNDSLSVVAYLWLLRYWYPWNGRSI